MDKRELLSQIVRDNIINPSGRVFYYPNIPAKVNKKLTAYFDSNIKANNIAVFFDTSIFSTCGYGLILTLTGLYYSDTFVKPHYINYKDIQLITVTPDNNGRTYTKSAKMDICLSNGTTFSIGYGDFMKDNLRDILNLICQEHALWDDIISGSPSGKVSS